MDIQFLLILLPAALADSINPCAFAILFVILSSITTQSGSKKAALFAGLSFTGAIFLSYYLMGIGAYRAFAFIDQFLYLQLIAAILALVIGLGNLKDYFWYGKYFSMEMPNFLKVKSRKWIAKITSPL
jgi:cytochrome c biogenesis protein CcdA